MTKQSGTRKSKAICSFCGRAGNQADTLIEGPNDVFICPECVELCHNIIKQNRRQVDGKRVVSRTTPKPREIKEYLDQYVIGQEKAKKYLSVAVHNHFTATSATAKSSWTSPMSCSSALPGAAKPCWPERWPAN